MVGISSIGVYIPRSRLDRSLIAKAWGGKQPPGDKAVAHHDEDALTLGVAAAHRCLEDFDALEIDGLFFASTSSPYREKQVASVVATACDLPRQILTADFGGSVRAGVSALSAAIRAVQSGQARRVLVVAADCRPADPESDVEGALGDGAVAVVVDGKAKLAEFVGSAAVAEEITYQWRWDQGGGVQQQDVRFALGHGYARDMEEVVSRVLNEHGVGTADLGALAVAAPDAKTAQSLAKQVGIDAKTQLVPALITQVGVLGTPDALLQLASALEKAKSGATVVAAAFGEGAEAILLRTTDGVAALAGRPGVGAAIERKLPLPTYEKYLKFRRIIGQDETPVELVSNVAEFRELAQDTRLYGTRCGSCGLVQYPMARVCLQCKAREGLEPVKLRKKGVIFTYTVDHLAANLDHPMGMVVVDLDGGGRVYVQMTDCTPDEVKIGAPVELTYRRLHSGGENYNYYWKARPV
ncbi:MAG: hydroxymethylglutaryl-CoA synthase family protein [Deltaproteobacteria bacterium]|nr:hydroxymethylglutaryl-CoA synthase family protein [Deltaproteobacteria bacterium]